MTFMYRPAGRPPNELHDVWKRVRIGAPDECWPYTGSKRRHGYGDFKSRNRHYSAHRLAYQLSTGIDPAGHLVCHTCDNPPCCNPRHLFLGTITDNNRDKCAKGRSARMPGSTNPNAKLTEAQVAEIRVRRLQGEKGRALAREFDVSPSRITMLVSPKYGIWTHV